MNGERGRLGVVVLLVITLLITLVAGDAAAQAKPEGEMRWAL